jgi:hypothetical protein
MSEALLNRSDRSPRNHLIEQMGRLSPGMEFWWNSSPDIMKLDHARILDSIGTFRACARGCGQ